MTHSIINEPRLGGGIYSVPDIARILGLPKHRVRYWLAKFWDGRFAKSASSRYSWGEQKSKAVNFYTLIEFYVYFQLRELGIRSAKILEAHEVISKALNTPFPFASSKILTDGKSILFSQDMDSIINADRSLQLNMKEIIVEFCKKIEFGNEDLAERFYPLGQKKSIVVDPHHQFGQPVIEGTNILAETIYSIHKAGEPVTRIAKLYELKPKQVRDAIAYFNEAA